MRTVLIAIVLFVGFILLKGIFKRKKAPNGAYFEGQVQRRALLNGAELELYARLQKACPDYLVLTQVALSQVVALRRGAPRSLTNRYYRLVADYVLCDKKGLPLLVIELDGRTHDTRQQSERDWRKNKALAAAGIPIIRFRVNDIVEPAKLRRRIVSVLA